MAWLLCQTMPEGVTPEMPVAVAKEMAVVADPPAGLIVHTVYTEDGRTKMCDVWESKEAFEAFRSSRLEPALTTVMERTGVNPMDGPPPELAWFELADLVRGR